jgi:hypothetical protein
MRFTVNNKSFQTILGGFTSTTNAHAHLFKHVVPLFEHACAEGSEFWEELIEDPPLEKEMLRRTRRAIDIIGKFENCIMVRQKQVKMCKRCSCGQTQLAIDAAFEALKDSYVGVAQQCVDWAFANRTASGEPRAFAFSTTAGWTLHAQDPRGVHVISALNLQSGILEVITCYRERRATRLTRRRSYEAMWLDQCREKAGCRTNENLLEIQCGGAS